LFSFITQNWRGRPLICVQAIVELIANTHTTKGLIVKAAVLSACYRGHLLSASCGRQGPKAHPGPPQHLVGPLFGPNQVDDKLAQHDGSSR